MANRSVLQIVALSGFLLAASIPARADERPPEMKNPPSSRATIHPDILTGRLSPKQLSLWKSLIHIVLATDGDGVPLHPKLHSLWQGAIAGGHAICIELPERREGTPFDAPDSFRSTSGTFTRPKTDQDGNIQPAIIRLDKSVIDSATSDPWEDGFQPFRGLGRNERYLEVLGHELAHAAAVFHDPDYAQKNRDLENAVDGFLEFWRTHRKMPESAEELRRRAQQIGMLTKVLEAPARAAEVEVWRELSPRNGGTATDRGMKRKPRASNGQ